jgi:hypothetical protein
LWENQSVAVCESNAGRGETNREGR